MNIIWGTPLESKQKYEAKGGKLMEWSQIWMQKPRVRPAFFKFIQFPNDEYHLGDTTRIKRKIKQKVGNSENGAKSGCRNRVCVRVRPYFSNLSNSQTMNIIWETPLESKEKDKAKGGEFIKWSQIWMQKPRVCACAAVVFCNFPIPKR